MTFEVLNRYETAMLNTAQQALEFIAASGSDHLRVHLDTFHMAVEETDMLGAVRSAVPVLGYLELGQSGRGPLAAGVGRPGRGRARGGQGGLPGADRRGGLLAFRTGERRERAARDLAGAVHGWTGPRSGGDRHRPAGRGGRGIADGTAS